MFGLSFRGLIFNLRCFCGMGFDKRFNRHYNRRCKVQKNQLSILEKLLSILSSGAEQKCLILKEEQ